MQVPIRFRLKRKRNTSQTTNNEDQFLKLPEPIIIYILSFLDLQDVIKTSVLSKSWKTLWTLVSNCNIVIRPVEKPRRMTEDLWISSFDQTLMNWEGNIDRFCLARHDYDFSAVIKKWIKRLLERKVKILKLEIDLKVPKCIFQSLSVTEVELVCSCAWSELDMPECEVSMSSLKSLLLDNVDLDEEIIERIMMGCPVLENFVLINVYDVREIKIMMGSPVLESFALINVSAVREIRIMSPSVKRFKLCNLENTNENINIEWGSELDVSEVEDELDDDSETEVERQSLYFKAPWLEELEISGKFINTHCQIEDVSCLIKATLTLQTAPYSCEFEYNERYNELWIPMVRKIMSTVSYVEELTIGSDPIQVLSLCKVSDTPSPLFKCKHLSIETCLWKFDIPGIACLLENAPYLETLFIKVLDDWQTSRPLDQTKKLFQVGDPHLGMPDGKFQNLKNVKIDYWRSTCQDSTDDQGHGDMFDFELAEYIVKSAVVLDKLVLCSSRSRCRFPSCIVPSYSFQCESCLSGKLIKTFLRVKKAEDWDVKKNNNMHEFTFKNHASLHPTSSSL